MVVVGGGGVGWGGDKGNRAKKKERNHFLPSPLVEVVPILIPRLE